MNKIKLLILDVDGVLTDGKKHYDKEGNRIKKGHPLYKFLDKKCRDFEDMVKGFFKNNTVDVINDAHLRIVNKDDETLGHFDRSILNNGGSDFLLLNKKQLKQLDILFDETTGLALGGKL